MLGYKQPCPRRWQWIASLAFGTSFNVRVQMFSFFEAMYFAVNNQTSHQICLVAARQQ
jgi:hypothetical protein